jgi:hypothetical protein
VKAPALVPVFHPLFGGWYVLSQDGTRVPMSVSVALGMMREVYGPGVREVGAGSMSEGPIKQWRVGYKKPSTSTTNTGRLYGMSAICTPYCRRRSGRLATNCAGVTSRIVSRHVEQMRGNHERPNR